MPTKINLVLHTTVFSLFAFSSAYTQDFDSVEMKVHPVSSNVSYIEGMGGNIGVFTGPCGVFLIDDQYAPLTDKIVTAIRGVRWAAPILGVHAHAPRSYWGKRKFWQAGYDDIWPRLTAENDGRWNGGAFADVTVTGN